MIEVGRVETTVDETTLFTPTEPTAPTEGAVEARRFAAVSQILRAIGALILLCSASAFLFQGWRSGDDLMRYGTLFGLTAVLAVAGVACGVAIRESKAARTLLGVVLALLPVHTTVLGALLYSQIAWDGLGAANLPAFGVWVAPSASVAVIVALAALAVLAPLIYLATRALVPPQAKAAALAVLGLNAVLMLPLRHEGATAIGMAMMTLVVLGLELRWVPRAACLQTFEGRLVRLLLIAPIGLMFGRAHLHSFTPALVDGAALIVVAAALFALARKFTERERVIETVEVAAVLPAFVGWAVVCHQLLDRISWLAIGLPLAVGLVVFSAWSAREGRAYRRLAAVIAALGATLDLCLDPGVGASLLGLGIGVATIAFGFFARQKVILAAGILAAASGLLYQLRFAFEIYSIGRWGSLAALGLATVIFAALLERYQGRMLEWSRRFRSQMRGWDL